MSTEDNADHNRDQKNNHETTEIGQFVVVPHCAEVRREVCPERVKRAVGHVEDPLNAKNDRQSNGNDKQIRPVDQAIGHDSKQRLQHV